MFRECKDAITILRSEIKYDTTHPLLMREQYPSISRVGSASTQHTYEYGTMGTIRLKHQPQHDKDERSWGDHELPTYPITVVDICSMIYQSSHEHLVVVLHCQEQGCPPKLQIHTWKYTQYTPYC